MHTVSSYNDYPYILSELISSVNRWHLWRKKNQINNSESADCVIVCKLTHRNHRGYLFYEDLDDLGHLSGQWEYRDRV